MPHRAPVIRGWEGDQVTCTCFLAPPGTRSVVSCSRGGTESETDTQPSNSRYQYLAVKKAKQNSLENSKIVMTKTSSAEKGVLLLRA